MEKRYKSFSRGFLWICIVTFGLFLLVAITSPYGYDKTYQFRVIQYGIDIEVPTNIVYDYLGNSHLAPEWSVYVSHITTLNSEEYPDGSVGSIRRCFTRADQIGGQWDELIVEDIPNVKRKLHLFNFVNFPISAEGLATEQLYEALPDNRTHLKLTLFYEEGSGRFWDTIKTYLAAYKIKSIFKQNMINIKHNVEKLDYE